MSLIKVIKELEEELLKVIELDENELQNSLQEKIKLTNEQVTKYVMILENGFFDNKINLLEEKKKEIEQEIKKLKNVEKFYRNLIARYIENYHNGLMTIKDEFTNTTRYVKTFVKRNRRVIPEAALRYTGIFGDVQIKLNSKLFNELKKHVPDIIEKAEIKPAINLTAIDEYENECGETLTDLVEVSLEHDIKLLKNKPQKLEKNESNI